MTLARSKTVAHTTTAHGSRLARASTCHQFSIQHSAFSIQHFQCPSCENTNSIGLLETLIRPSSGPSSSSTRNTAAATDTAATKKTATTVAFRGAYSPKLANVAVSQKTTTTRKAIGTAPP